MQIIALNQVSKEFIGQPVGASAVLYDQCLQILITVENPTPKEIEEMSKDIVFKYLRFDRIPYMAIKFGDLEYMDTPVVAHDEPDHLKIEDGYGFHVNIILADPSTGHVRALRSIGLSTDMSKAIQKDLIGIKGIPVSHIVPYVLRLQQQYTTEQVVEMAQYSFEIKN